MSELSQGSRALSVNIWSVDICRISIEESSENSGMIKQEMVNALVAVGSLADPVPMPSRRVVVDERGLPIPRIKLAYVLAIPSGNSLASK